MSKGRIDITRGRLFPPAISEDEGYDEMRIALEEETEKWDELEDERKIKRGIKLEQEVNE